MSSMFVFVLYVFVLYVFVCAQSSVFFVMDS